MLLSPSLFIDLPLFLVVLLLRDATLMIFRSDGELGRAPASLQPGMIPPISPIARRKQHKTTKNMNNNTTQYKTTVFNNDNKSYNKNIKAQLQPPIEQLQKTTLQNNSKTSATHYKQNYTNLRKIQHT